MALIDRFLKHPAKFLAHLESPEGKEFRAYLEDLHLFNDKILREATGEAIYRAQGAIKILNSLLDLPHEIRAYQKQVGTKGPDGVIPMQKVGGG